MVERWKLSTEKPLGRPETIREKKRKPEKGERRNETQWVV